MEKLSLVWYKLICTSSPFIRCVTNEKGLQPPIWCESEIWKWADVDCQRHVYVPYFIVLRVYSVTLQCHWTRLAGGNEARTVNFSRHFFQGCTWKLLFCYPLFWNRICYLLEYNSRRSSIENIVQHLVEF